MYFTAVNLMIFNYFTKKFDEDYPALQAGGHRFESDYLHHSKSSTYRNVGAFLYLKGRDKGVISASFYYCFLWANTHCRRLSVKAA